MTCSRLYSNCTKSKLSWCWKFRDFQIAGNEIRTVEYAGDFVLLVKEEAVLEGIIDTITEIGWFFAIEMNM
jgi:hypothetical protein